ncbi:MAG: hypothetical protein KIS62_01460 [Ramlibacter sp.]|nr:hypothetical protein [Ramlibacter sp.]
MTTKRRARRKPNRWGTMTPLEIALSQARKFTPAELVNVMANATAARHALQYGGFKANDWGALAEALNHSEALAQPGLNLAPDHMHTIEAGQQAVADIRTRRASVGTWGATGPELQALDDALWIWRVQLTHASVGEYRRGLEWVTAEERKARAGQPGRTVVHMDEIRE